MNSYTACVIPTHHTLTKILQHMSVDSHVKHDNNIYKLGSATFNANTHNINNCTCLSLPQQHLTLTRTLSTIAHGFRCHSELVRGLLQLFVQRTTSKPIANTTGLQSKPIQPIANAKQIRSTTIQTNSKHNRTFQSFAPGRHGLNETTCEYSDYIYIYKNINLC